MAAVTLRKFSDNATTDGYAPFGDPIVVTTFTASDTPSHAALYNVPTPGHVVGVSLTKASDYRDGYGREYAVGE